jgi:hypothetical protein
MSAGNGKGSAESCPSLRELSKHQADECALSSESALRLGRMDHHNCAHRLASGPKRLRGPALAQLAKTTHSIKSALRERPINYPANELPFGQQIAVAHALAEVFQYVGVGLCLQRQ